MANRPHRSTATYSRKIKKEVEFELEEGREPAFTDEDFGALDLFGDGLKGYGPKSLVPCKRNNIIDPDAEGLVPIPEYVDDEEEIHIQQKPGAGGPGRHSESKKELLKVIENNVARLMNERTELEKLEKRLGRAEEAMDKDVKWMEAMLEYSESTGVEEMEEGEWEQFFLTYFVEGQEDPNMEEDEEAKLPDMEMD